MNTWTIYCESPKCCGHRVPYAQLEKERERGIPYRYTPVDPAFVARRRRLERARRSRVNVRLYPHPATERGRVE